MSKGETRMSKPIWRRNRRPLTTLFTRYSHFELCHSSSAVICNLINIPCPPQVKGPHRASIALIKVDRIALQSTVR
jgi:hypothetical protein